MGAEVQRPLATVVIGGVIGAMIMSLLVLRVLYLLFSAAISRHDHDRGHIETTTIEPLVAELLDKP